MLALASRFRAAVHVGLTEGLQILIQGMGKGLLALGRGLYRRAVAVRDYLVA